MSTHHVSQFLSLTSFVIFFWENMVFENQSIFLRIPQRISDKMILANTLGSGMNVRHIPSAKNVEEQFPVCEL